ncbi:hypothetical protein DXG01_012936 [Tephrocybe rancida]|nr:hypothetical protein DXG01_012936 [Tephrocybe rancida]
MSVDSITEKRSDRDSESLKTEYVDTPEDRKLLRKVDLQLATLTMTILSELTLTFSSLLPILTGLYLLSFLDRSNVGNAKIVGLATDLKISGPEYNTALALYFVAYVLFEVPANVRRPVNAQSLHGTYSLTHIQIILKRFNPRVWLPTLTLLWGITSVGQGLIKNKSGLFGIRFFDITELVLLGANAAGELLYSSEVLHWQVHLEVSHIPRQKRTLVLLRLPGILAYAIGKMEGVGGKKGWEWIFIIEGLLTIAVSLIAYFVVPTWSHSAKFLTEPERERLLARLNADSDAGQTEEFRWFYVRQAFTDPVVWGYALLFHGYAFVLYSLSLFLPTIIAGLGYATWKAQLQVDPPIFPAALAHQLSVHRLTVPPNALAALSIALTVWISSRTNLRAPFIVGAAVVAIIGYIILMTTHTAGAQYVGVHFAAAGVYTGNALLLSWPGENVSSQTKRAVAVAMQITIGDIGAISGVLVYRPKLSANHFRTPHAIAIGYLVFAIIVATTLATWMKKENKRRDQVLSQEKEAEFYTPKQRKVKELGYNLGDRDLHYRYVY